MPLGSLTTDQVKVTLASCTNWPSGGEINCGVGGGVESADGVIVVSAGVCGCGAGLGAGLAESALTDGVVSPSSTTGVSEDTVSVKGVNFSLLIRRGFKVGFAGGR